MVQSLFFLEHDNPTSISACGLARHLRYIGNLRLDIIHHYEPPFQHNFDRTTVSVVDE